MLAQTDLVLSTSCQFTGFYENTLALKNFALPIKFPPTRICDMWHQRVHVANAKADL